MAGTAVTVTNEFAKSPTSEVEQLRLTVNQLIDDLELLRSHVATGTGVTATAAAALLAGKVNLR